jgi:hypothetical protein
MSTWLDPHHEQQGNVTLPASSLRWWHSSSVWLFAISPTRQSRDYCNLDCQTQIAHVPGWQWFEAAHRPIIQPSLPSAVDWTKRATSVSKSTTSGKNRQLGAYTPSSHWQLANEPSHHPQGTLPLHRLKLRQTPPRATSSCQP